MKIGRAALLCRQRIQRKGRKALQGWLFHFFSRGDLSWLQKSFDEFAFAADGHAGKFLEPFSVRHFGFGIEPVGQKPKLIGGDVATTDAVEQMGEKLWRKIVPTDARHGYSP